MILEQKLIINKSEYHSLNVFYFDIIVKQFKIKFYQLSNRKYLRFDF